MTLCSRLCKECPFNRNSIKGYLGQGKEDALYLNEIKAIYDAEQPFVCHMRLSTNMTFDEIRSNPKAPICRGFIAMYKASCKLPKDKQLAQMVAEITPEEAATVLKDWEFLAYHKGV